MRTVFFTGLLLFVDYNIQAQTGQNVDSLQQVLSVVTEDENRAKLYDALSDDLVYSDLSLSLSYVDTMMLLAEKLSDQELINAANYNYSVIYRLQGDFRKALEMQKIYAQEIEKSDDQLATAQAYYQLGATSLRLDEYDNSAQHLQKALSHAEEMKDLSLAYRILNAQGVLFKQLDQGNEALQAYRKAIKYCLMEGDTTSLPILYNSIGILYKNMDSMEVALTYFEDGLEIAEKTGNVSAIATHSRNIGLYHLEKGELDIAGTNYKKALDIRLKMNSQLPIGGSYSDLAEVYLQKGLFPQAEENIIKAKDIFDKIGATVSQNFINEQLHRLYQAEGDYQLSNQYLTSYYHIKDSLENNELRSKISELDVKYESSKKDNEIANQQLQINNSTSQRNLAIFGGLAILGLAGFLFYRNRKNQHLAKAKIDNLQKQQKLLALDYMVQGQEEERKRIAQDLHDGLGGLLASARIQIQKVEKEMQKLGQMQLLSKAESMIDNAHQEVRRISHDMMPGALMDLGLIDAVEDLVERMGRDRAIRINLSVPTYDIQISDQISINIYRVIQELLNNTIKHAEAEKVVLNISATERKLLIEYEDDGVGFDYTVAKMKDGLGLAGIESRVAYLGGRCEVVGQQEQGTSYKIEVPLKSNS